MSLPPNPATLESGHVIAICYPIYKHFALVSDEFIDGFPNLISLSSRTGKVCEEPWHIVVGDKKFEISKIRGKYSQDVILRRARECMQLDICYKLLTFNCEHFVRYAHGLPVESRQVQRALYGAILGATSCLLLPKITIARISLMVAAGTVASLKNSLRKI